jgi:hypothetical protein
VLIDICSKGVFVYGNIGDDKEQEQHLLYPYVLSKVCPFFSYKGSRLGVEKSKESTARVVMWKELNIPSVYTIEASFYGASKDKHFTTTDLMEIGKNLCQAVSIYEKVLDRDRSDEQAAKIINEIIGCKLVVLKKNKELSDSDSCSEDNAEQSELNKMIQPIHEKQEKKGSSVEVEESSPVKRQKHKVSTVIKKFQYKKILKKKITTKPTNMVSMRRSEVENSCKRITKSKKEIETPYRNNLRRNFELNRISRDNLKYRMAVEGTTRNVVKYQKRKVTVYNKSISPDKPNQAKSLLKLATEKTYYETKRVSFDKRKLHRHAVLNFNPNATEAPFSRKYSNRRTSHRLRTTSSNSFCQAEKTSAWEASPSKINETRRRSNDVKIIQEVRNAVADGGVFSYSFVTRLANKRLNEALFSRSIASWFYSKK